MKVYSKKIFSNFSEEKQGRIIVEWAHHLEKNWLDKDVLLQLRDYVDVALASGYEVFVDLRGQLNSLSESNLGAKNFVAAVVPLERIYYRSLKEHEIQVKTSDRNVAKKKIPLAFVLHNIRSTFNIGTFFRTAECLGCERIYLCGYTATADHEGVQKTSMGTSSYLPWSYEVSIEKTIEDLQGRGYQVLGLETAEGAKSLYDLSFDSSSMPKIALVFGNEYFGLEKRVLDLVDHVVEVPTFGQKNSLNVSVCASICGYELMRRWL